ncbi:uncharacterized protein PADG_03837 [Paracoccidioides brasiliensis Pb18]|uniref:ML-like domain-containing protein n=2 Tax=Paracoccidioides brasiliensis TaxID=121759 RepID=C1G9A1_PARBD|nr:uncharacterized protein PADG_03837 [Paracoccidioides brasiliensis Pb18]EEH47753.2 hypothetical protein PADG_03837 [Paracoccidioides brasiliensis Pb18]ODH39446.1 hypothetical protein ACO22_01903 [Paracoccidioides brasiliensis]ODH47445.1 hypothetical protein GX48_06481 [Paracoccidioides brasiliensis]
MRIRRLPKATLLLAWGLLLNHVDGADVLKNNGFTTCLGNSDIRVDRINLEFDRATNSFKFDVAGSSNKSQSVMAVLAIEAYGQRFTQDFNPCSEKTKVEQLCPVPAGQFSAIGTQKIPSDFASKIPSIAFAVPDLQADATLQLKAIDGGQTLACISSKVGNGKTLEAPAVSYAAAGIAAAALALSGAAALAASGNPGAATSSPTFGEVVGWFQTMATCGMLSVNYPPMYRSFTKNFAFSTGLIPWNQMQIAIDNFRNKTGGNLTHNNFPFLQNATLIFQDGSNSSSLGKRSLDSTFRSTHLVAREITTSINETSTGGSGESDEGGLNHVVKGIQGYVEMLSVPEANTFMTVLLIFAVVVAAIATGILLFKVILEVWAMFTSFPKKLSNFRKDYWGIIARTITNLILILYGIFTLYCVFQFTRGDSWAAKILAGVTLAIFTAVLAFFTFKIWRIARKYKQVDGTAAALYEDHETWRKYSLFYDNYKKGYWWIFVPTIIYMLVRGCIIAGGDGNGLAQTAGQLVVEAVMLILLLWSRPYEAKSGQWINISIQVVRVLSVVCILVFVQELGVSQTTQTITGVVLITVQSALTGILAILIAVNAIILCFRKNPHKARQRKDLETMDRDLDTLTPLDARNSLLERSNRAQRHPSTRKDTGFFNRTAPYEPYFNSPFPEKPRHIHTESADSLLSNNANNINYMNMRQSNQSPSPERQSMLPVVGRAY